MVKSFKQFMKEDSCWKDYKQLGYKEKNGKSVPNCIPESNEDKDYKKFFKGALKKFNVTEPDQLEGEKKKEFFDYVDKNWKADKESD